MTNPRDLQKPPLLESYSVGNDPAASVLDLMKKRRASGNYGVGWHSTGFGNQVLPQSQRQISLHEERLE
jgi:hypothetical protein